MKVSDIVINFIRHSLTAWGEVTLLMEEKHFGSFRFISESVARGFSGLYPSVQQTMASINTHTKP